MNIDVKGHSGCQIDIVREQDALYVCKMSKDPKYAGRLRLQAEKQKQAYIDVVPHFKVPFIYDIFSDPESVSVKMEYVYSKNFMDFFESSGFGEIENFTNSLIKYIEFEISQSDLCAIDESVFKEKFIEVKTRVFENALLAGKKEVLEIMGRSENIFRTLKGVRVPVGKCHGDLTFSNILFCGGNYYLIDFLDSFIESPLQDIVKLRQDTKYRWSQLMYSHPFDSFRWNMICEKIDDILDSAMSKYVWYVNYYKSFQLMNLLRVLQYAREEKVSIYLLNHIKELLNEF